MRGQVRGNFVDNLNLVAGKVGRPYFQPVAIHHNLAWLAQGIVLRIVLSNAHMVMAGIDAGNKLLEDDRQARINCDENQIVRVVEVLTAETSTNQRIIFLERAFCS